MQTLTYFPGQKVTIFLEVTDGYDGYDQVRIDSLSLPVVTRIISPNFTLMPGYPANMIRIDTGLYYYQFVLPTGAVAVGSYLVDVAFISAITGVTNNQAYQIVVNAPFGNFSTTIGI